MRYNPVPKHPHWLQVREAGEFLGLVGHNGDGLWTYSIGAPIADPGAFIFATRSEAARNLSHHARALKKLVA